MSTKKLVIILIVIAAVVALGYWKAQKGPAKVAPLPAPSVSDVMEDVSTSGDTMQEIPAATGNVDETVDSLLAAVEQENKIVLDESSEADLINAEVDALDQYGQSYEPSEF